MSMEAPRPNVIPRPDILKSVDLEDRPAKRVFIVAAAMQTPLGDLRGTLDARMRGESAVVPYETGLDDVHVASPLNFYAKDHMDLKGNAKWYSELGALELYVVTQALGNAQLLDGNGKLDASLVNIYKGGLFGNSGVGQILGLVDVNDMIKLNNDLKRALANGQITKEQFLQQRAVIKASDSFQAFPDQGNGRTVEYHGIRGKGNFSSQACASGLAAVVDAYESIKSGKNRWAIAGGIERTLTHPELSFTTFNVLTALSHNPDPQTASRPLDSGRDGFVYGEGAAYLILMNEETALATGATVLAEITGGENVMDGFDKIKASSDRIAMAIGKTMETETGDVEIPDIAYLHLTSTKLGDEIEIEAVRKIWGERVGEIPIVGNKSSLGHTIGAAGAINAIEATYAIYDGMVAPTIHLVNRSEKFIDLNVAREARRVDPRTALITANGFGGWTSALRLVKYAA